MTKEYNFSTWENYKRLFEQIKPSLTFGDRKKEDWESWRKELKGVLWKLLRLDKMGVCYLEPETISRQEFGNYIIEEIVYQVEPDVWTPAELLIPKGLKSPTKAIVNCHGHGTGYNYLLYRYRDFFVERGYIVLTPEVRDFGRRSLRDPEKNDCTKSVTLATLLGRTVAGMRLWDAMRAVDYLEFRPEVNLNRIGCVGLSLGGELSLLLGALDDRIKVVDISGFLTTYKSMMLMKEMDNCVCYAVPDLLEYCDMPDIAGLIAPRPLIVEHGLRDEWFNNDDVQLAFNSVKKIYEVIGAGDKVDIDYYDGPHKFSGAKSLDWFDKWL